MIRTEPYDYQEEDSDKAAFDYDGRAILGWEPGAGKTFGALLTLEKLKVRKRPIVVVCPAIAKMQWKRQCREHFQRPATVLYGRKPYKLRGGRRIYVLNYDILGHLPRRKKGDKKIRTWVDALRAIDPEAIILDEIHWVANPGAQRSKACKRLVRWIRYRIGLSGTPMPNYPIDLWHPLALIKPKLFPTRWAYAFKFCAGHRGDYGKEEVRGASNHQELHKILTHPKKGVLLRRRKIDIIKDLPKKNHIFYPLTLNRKQRKEYEWARDNFLGWLGARNPRKMMRAKRARAFLKIGYLKRLIADFKLSQVIDWIEEFLEASDQKLLVFGHHHKILTPIYEAFKNKAILLTGKTPEKQRTIITDRFNTDPKCRLGVMNMKAGGVAWSCRSCTNVAFVEFSWLPTDHEQSADRCHGIKRGIKGMPLNLYWLLMEDTIEEANCESLQKKSNNISKMLDGKKAPDDAQLLDLMVKALKKEQKASRRK